MIIGKSDEVWHSEIDELVDSTTDTSLTEDEYERKQYLKELVEDGYYDPFRIDQADIAELMKWKNIISEEDVYLQNFTGEDEKKLADVLENDWDNLSEYCKVVYHIIRDTPGLPRWRKPYPPTQEHTRTLREFLKINPKSMNYSLFRAR